MSTDQNLDAAFTALAHPVRRAILARLIDGEATVNALAAPFEMSLPAVSRHIAVLENGGLISRRHTAQFRYCRIDPDGMAAVARWADAYRPIWDARFDAMDAVLAHKEETEDD